MAGPTTEAVNEDVKVLREDLHKVEIGIRSEIARVETSLSDRISKVEVSLRDEIHRVESSLSKSVVELSVKTSGVLTAIRLLAVLAITGLATAVWTLATLSATAKATDARLDRIETAISKLAPANPK